MMGNMDNDQIKKILIVLARANSPAPLEYISINTGIKEPLKILRKLEEMGLVRQTPSSSWSCCMDPMFEITSAARKELLIK
jgi:DNA-binding IclR family transcriptional regulator